MQFYHCLHETSILHINNDNAISTFTYYWQALKGLFAGYFDVVFLYFLKKLFTFNLPDLMFSIYYSFLH